jgi:hypothetical protein
MKKIAVFLCVVFSFSVAASAQTTRRTVTNFELEKYRNQRITSEREYRETYAQRGMLSPEELKAANESRIQQTIDLAAKLRDQELEERRLALEARAQEIQLEDLRARQAEPIIYPYDNSIWGGGIIDGGFGGRFHGRRFPRFLGRGVYAAGGNVWPAPLGSQTFQRPRPMFNVGGRRGHR